MAENLSAVITAPATATSASRARRDACSGLCSDEEAGNFVNRDFPLLDLHHSITVHWRGPERIVCGAGFVVLSCCPSFMLPKCPSKGAFHERC